MLRAVPLLVVAPLVAGLAAQQAPPPEIVPFEIVPFEIVLDAAPRAVMPRGDLTASVRGATIADATATFARDDALVEFGPDPRLGRDASRSFTLECSLRTTHGGFCTPLMCRDGERVCYSLVLGRRPGTISFEVWSWSRDKAISQVRIDDGAWHQVRAAFDAPTRTLVLLVDDTVQAIVPMHGTSSMPPHPRLRLGNNIGAHQPYPGALRGVRLRDGVPEAAREAIAARRAWAALDPSDAEASMEAWLVRHRAPRRPSAASADAWRRRARTIRSRLQDALGLWPPPYARARDLAAAGQPPVTDFARFVPQLDLDLQKGGSLDRDGYRLTRLYWQTIAGYYASGWLYRPSGAARAARPAVLCPHGHWSDGARHPVVQARCITLARRGYVVLAVDSVHVYDDPIGLAPLGLMTWNNLRGLEVLRGLPDVDAARIGCTGASGGGQQTFYLTGLASGLAAAVPAVMVCHFDEILLSSGVHCHCNFTPGLMTFGDEPELSAAFAPQPQLFLSVTGDWTKNFPEQGFPEIRAVYELFDAGDRVRSRQWTSQHDYNRDMRNAMYAFFERWLNGIDAPDPAIEPMDLRTEAVAALRALDRDDVPRDLGAVRREFRARLGRPQAQVTERGGIEAVAQRARAMPRLEPPDQPAARERGKLEWHGRPATVRAVESEPGIEIPITIFAPREATRRTVVVLGDEGRSAVAVRHRHLLEQLLDDGFTVALADVRYTGAWDVAHAWRDPYGKILGRDEATLAALDLRCVLRALDADAADAAPTVVLAYGSRGAGALLTAAMATGDREFDLVIPELGPLYRRADRRPKAVGILRYLDLDDAALLVPPAALAVGGCQPADFAATRARAERVDGAAPCLIREEPLDDRAILTWLRSLR